MPIRIILVVVIGLFALGLYQGGISVFSNRNELGIGLAVLAALLCSCLGLIPDDKWAGKITMMVIFFFVALAIPLVGVVVCLVMALALLLRSPYVERTGSFLSGNKLITEPYRIGTREQSELPIVQSSRTLPGSQVENLLIGLNQYQSDRIVPVYRGLRKSDDTHVQLLAQGGIADAVDVMDNQLHDIRQRLIKNPKSRSNLLAAAEIYHAFVAKGYASAADIPKFCQKGIDYADQVLEINADDAEALDFKARFLLSLGKREEAEDCLERLRKIDPENVPFLEGEFLARSGDLKELAGHVKKAPTGSPDWEEVRSFWNEPKPLIYR